jgi:predicted nucleic acid-binding protein
VPRGRPPLERGVLSVSSAPQDLIVLDTSAVIRALVEDQTQHGEYADYLVRSVEHGTDFAYSDLVELEIAQACTGIALRQRHGRRWNDHRHDGRALRPARDLTARVLEAWFTLLSQVNSVHIPVGPLAQGGPPGEVDDPDLGSPVRDRALDLMATCAISSYDAAHAAGAILLEAPLLTADVGFGRVPADVLTIVTDSTRVAGCRRYRGGSSAQRV